MAKTDHLPSKSSGTFGKRQRASLQYCVGFAKLDFRATLSLGSAEGIRALGARHCPLFSPRRKS